MQSPWPIILAVLAARASVAAAHNQEYIDAEALAVAEHVEAHAHHAGPACGTVHSEPPSEHVADLKDFSKRHLTSFQPVTVSVIMHISWSEETRKKSYIPRDKIDQAFENANRVLAGTSNQGSAGTNIPVDTGFRLRLHEVKYYEVTSSTQSPAQGTLVGTQTAMHEWQAANAVDPTKYANVWVTDTGVAGGRVDYMPWRTLEGGETNPHWGWIQNWGIFPNNNFASVWGANHAFNEYNSGDSLAHEFGHYLNLYHTFNAGCYSISGDYIADTPAEGSPWRDTCRGNKVKSGSRWKVRNSCTNQAGNDDVSNIMDYSKDSCRDHFTAGQAAWMQSAIMRYKPKLYAHSLANSAGPSSSSPETNPPTSKPTTSPPAPVNPSCTTIGGANKMRDGTNCVFPFFFKGKQFNGCASLAANDKPYMGKFRRGFPIVKTETNYWCPTTKYYSTRNKRKRAKWGFCNCNGVDADDMLTNSVGHTEGENDVKSGVLEYESDNTGSGNTNKGEGSTAETTTKNGGSTAAVAVLATLCTLMVVGLAGVAVYYRQRLHALAGGGTFYEGVQPTEKTQYVTTRTESVEDGSLSEI